MLIDVAANSETQDDFAPVHICHQQFICSNGHRFTSQDIQIQFYVHLPYVGYFFFMTSEEAHEFALEQTRQGNESSVGTVWLDSACYEF